VTIPPDHSLPALIEARRTSLRMDADRAVDPEVIAELCRLATWAPNHHRTEPWRFAVFSGDGRRVLGDTIAAQMLVNGTPPERVAKTRVKYLRAPAMLIVGSTGDHDALTALENRDAVAAGIQNLLLAATAAGLASFWSSVATPDAPGLLELCGFDEDTVVVAAIYLGHPTGECPPPARTPPAITWHD
jgi:nitroreductase